VRLLPRGTRPLSKLSAQLTALQATTLTRSVRTTANPRGLRPTLPHSTRSTPPTPHAGFARLFFHQPKYAVLDEATSAVNPEGEKELYRRTVAMRTTVFSIAHRMELRHYHQLELQLTGDGSGDWRLLPLQ